MNRTLSVFGLAVCALASVADLPAQSLGNAGTVTGTVMDPSGAAIAGATVAIHSPTTGYSQSVVTSADGAFRLVNIPPDPYHLEVTAPGFNVFSQDLNVRGSIPLQIKATLTLSGTRESITVESQGTAMVETDPTAHVDVDSALMLKLPMNDPGSGLSDAITYSTGGVAADSNGLFHPLGDHAQVSFVIDGQEISDQQSKVFPPSFPPARCRAWS